MTTSVIYGQLDMHGHRVRGLWEAERQKNAMASKKELSLDAHTGAVRQMPEMKTLIGNSPEADTVGLKTKRVKPTVDRDTSL